MTAVFDNSVVDLAKQQLGDLIEAIGELPPIANLRELIERLSSLEYGFERARLNLRALHRRGMATPSDYIEFGRLRSSLIDAQKKVLRLVRLVFAGAPDVLRQIPGFSPPPALAQPSTLPNGTHLGAAPVAAAAIPAWMAGTIILAAIVVGGITIISIVIAGAVAAEALRDVWMSDAQLEAHNQATERRLRLYEQCRAEGNTVEACRLMADNVVPPPPVFKPSSGSWVPWLIGGGVLALGVLGYGAYRVFKAGESSAPQYYVPAVRGVGDYRQLSRDEYLTEPDRYGLEVGE